MLPVNLGDPTALLGPKVKHDHNRPFNLTTPGAGSSQHNRSPHPSISVAIIDAFRTCSGYAWYCGSLPARDSILSLSLFSQNVHRPFTKLALNNFDTIRPTRHGKFIDLHDPPRYLVTGEPLAAFFEQLDLLDR